MKEHPDIILDKLKGSTNTRGGRNLDIVHGICRLIFAAPAPKDYSLVTVGKRSQEINGPSLNTFYSPKGARFRELVAAWARYDGTNTKKPNKTISRSSDQEMLISIKDFALRGRVGMILADRSRLESELNVCKANAKIQVDLRPTPGNTHLAGNQLIQVFEPLANLHDTEIEAFKTACTEKWLPSRGMEEGPDGEVMDNKGHIKFPIGFMHAIRKVLSGLKR